MLKEFTKYSDFALQTKKIRKKIKIVMCVPYTLIYFFSSKLKSKFISLGAQNCHHNQDDGAFTGSINASMLKEVGAKYVIIGHSENRFEGETNKIIGEKVESVLNKNLKVIFCIGETFNEKLKNKTFLTLKNQMKDSIKKKFNLDNIIIAYEPKWSIGTGKIPKSYELEKIFNYIKNQFKKTFKTKKFPTVLYGGSVNVKNIRKLSTISLLDGFLIGGASQSPKKFIDIIKNYYK